ncbi:hypothetical protein DFH09DRAFT_1414272 [Mycena vulgaris]|nr:hypothetical protein DFH09DRAFT_1414272 [Mycena vulgaris]
MFEAAVDIPLGEIKAYKKFIFPEVLGDPGHDPFFSGENATSWITSLAYQLFLEHDDSVIPTRVCNLDDASAKQLKAYRRFILSDEYVGHPFFSLENPEIWINPIVFEAYMTSNYGLTDGHRGRRDDSTPFSSRAPSRAASSVSRPGSRASSHMSLFPPSRPSSPVSLASSDMPSRPASVMSTDDFIEIHDSDPDDNSVPAYPLVPQPNLISGAHYSLPAHITVPKIEHQPSTSLSIPLDLSQSRPTTVKRKGKGKGKAVDSHRIHITRQLIVDIIVDVPGVQLTWTVPRTPTAYRVDVSSSKALLTTSSGKTRSIDAYIRSEDQESWAGSSGHAKGDVMVRGFTSDPTEEIHCRRCYLECNGVDTCEFIDPQLFADCQRFEVDKAAVQELWNQELDANEREAASAPGIISRFYARIRKSKCKVECDGLPTLIRRSKGPSAHGKHFFIGCSKWTPMQRYEHLFWPMPPNVDEAALKFAMEHDGSLRTGPVNLNEKCVLTVHPRVGLKDCPFTHFSSHTLHKALVILRNPHNHPAHPTTKPGALDRAKLETAVNAAGLTGLTVQKLLNAPSTSIVYNGARVADSSPAFADSRRLRDFIGGQKKKEHPRGMGWDGVLYHLREREVKLPKEERYVHTAMDKNGFRLAVTMYPYITMFIHQILSLNIDYTFKRVEGTMDEWEVAGFLDRFKHRLTFASLYCDTQSTESFGRLFTELFDSIHRVTGERLKLAPFYPDANCRVVTLDGEVPQALGFGNFLAKYNDPEISKIWAQNPLKLIPYTLKTCNPHFQRHIDELSTDIPKSGITRLKSIMGLETQDEIDEWHKYCAAQTQPDIKNWYAHKLANPWALPSINKFLSKISAENWDITPNHSNYVETAHAGRNAETSVGVGILTAILEAKARDDIKAAEMMQIERDGVMRRRWNGPADREKLSAQRQVWKMRKSAVRNDQLTSYETLKAERDAGLEDNKASLERQKTLEGQIKGLQEEMKLDKHRTDLKEQVNVLRRDIEEEKALRRDWNIRRKTIEDELDRLKKGPLAGVRVKGRRPAENPSSEHDSAMLQQSMMADTVSSGRLDENYGGNSDFDGDGGQIEDTAMPVDTYHAPNQSLPQSTVQNSAMVLNNDFSAELAAFENNMFNNQSNLPIDPGLEELLADFDPLLFDFGTTYGLNVYDSDLGSYSGDYRGLGIGTAEGDFGFEFEDGELEYCGPPGADHSGAALVQQVPALGAILPRDPDPTEDDWGSGFLNLESSNFTTQDLPHLPPPPASSSPDAELDEPSVNLAADPDHVMAPNDIDLEVNDRNIIPGKRQRTMSTRATDAAEGRATKKLPGASGS